MEKILTEYGDIRRLAREFEVSELTIRRAIQGKTKSVLACNIRERVVNEYGRKLVELN